MIIRQTIPMATVNSNANPLFSDEVVKDLVEQWMKKLNLLAIYISSSLNNKGS